MSTIGNRAVAVFAAVAAAVSPAVATAGPAADKVAAAEALLKQPDAAIDALKAFDDAIDAFWMTMPLTFRAVTFADSVTAYGQYVPRKEAVFHPGEQVQVYVALAGYGFRPINTGYRVDFSVAIQIRTPSGSVLARADDFGQLTRDASVESHEFAAGLPVTLPYLKPGDYILRLALRDNQNGKLAGADLPITVVAMPMP